MEWWKRLHLVDNPFERLKGLPDDLSDTVVETSIFKKFFDRMKNPNSMFKKVFLISGPFGSGKTTFFSYLANKCRAANIKPVFINANPSLNEGNEILEDIKMKIIKELDYQPSSPRVDEIDILNCLAIYKDAKKCEGIILFVDELHRNTNMDAIYTFLQLLQGLTEYIFKNDFPLGVFIAGKEDWRERLEKEPAYSGVVDVSETIDPITVDEGYQIVTKRLKKFAEEGYKKHIYITKQAVEKIFEDLSQRTPRELLFKVGQQFKNLPENKETLEATDIVKEVDPNLINTIRRKLHSAGRVNNKLRRILEYKTDDERKQAFDFIAKLYNKRFLEEHLTEEILKTYGVEKDYIIVDLETWGVITRRTTKTTIGNKIIAKNGYTLSSDVQNIFDGFVDRYGLKPEDYLSKIYLGEKKAIIERKEETAESPEHQQLRDIYKALKKMKYKIASKHIEKIMGDYLRIYKFLSSPRSNLSPNDIPRICIDSIDEFLMAYYIFEKKDDNATLPIPDLHKYMLGIFNIEELEELYAKHQAIKFEGKTIDRIEAGNIAELYLSTLKELINIFKEEIDFNVPLPLNKRLLTSNDFKKLREIRLYILKERDPIKARNKLLTFFERKMREYIAAILNLQFGGNWLKERVYIMKQIREGIMRTIDQKRSRRTDFEEKKNKLEYADLQHLLQIIKNQGNWNHCFRNIFGKNDDNKNTLDVYWKHIYMVRTDFAHFDDYDRAISNAFNFIVWIIEWINRYIEYFIQNKKADMENIGRDVTGKLRIKIYFTDKNICRELIVDEDDIKEILDYIKKNQQNKEILFKIDPKFHATYEGRKQVGLFIYLIKNYAITIEEVCPDYVKFHCNMDKIEELMEKLSIG